jgi:hypothetical protein
LCVAALNGDETAEGVIKNVLTTVKNPRRYGTHILTDVKNPRRYREGEDGPYGPQLSGGEVDSFEPFLCQSCDLQSWRDVCKHGVDGGIPGPVQLGNGEGIAGRK